MNGDQEGRAEMLLVERPAQPLGSLGHGWDEAWLKDICEGDPRWAWTDPRPWPSMIHAGAMLAAIYGAMSESGLGAGAASQPARVFMLGMLTGELIRGSLDEDPKRSFALASLAIPRDPPLGVWIEKAAAERIDGWQAMEPNARFEAAAKAVGINLAAVLEAAFLPLAAEAELAERGMEKLGAERRELLEARELARFLERDLTRARAAAKPKGL